MSIVARSQAVAATTAVSITTLPKVALSYKWIINDAEVFLVHQKELRSQLFSLHLPSSKANSAGEQSSWCLRIDKYETQSSTGAITTYYYVSLCQGKYRAKSAIFNESLTL